ncbi:MAG: endonuclease/exonuclease/phosphatase family protein [Bacteroidaceae bacterium]|nr:endonuclease/exonuclease/phosphatase family protein [Bacteroidaceae bacterium]
MRKFNLLYLLSLLFVFVFTANAQEKKYEVYSVGFYNLENLFDTIHDAGKNDFEFLPDGTNKWGTLKYTNKLKNMATVLNEMGTDVLPVGMAAVGVSEIENSRVLHDLVNHEILAPRGWDFVHIEGPDKRGVDCALLYNPKLFKPTNSMLAPYTTVDNDTTYKTRGFLVVTGEMGGETVHIIVNHWPSRYAKSPARERAGILVRELKDSIMKSQPDSKVIIMGDMNDDPDDKSMKTCLGAVREKKDIKGDTDLYNPWWNILRKKGHGTLKYKGKWNLFDQIVLSGNLVGDDRSTLKLYKTEIFSRNYMFQQEGRYKGNTKRTHAGGVWLNGYSDHLPVIVYLLKEAK